MDPLHILPNSEKAQQNKSFPLFRQHKDADN
jgi:hypothetical protein